MAQRCGLSQSAVSRIWRAFVLQPHRTETFKLSKDPLFIEKVRDIVGLYLNPPDKALRIPAMAAELVRLRVDVIVAPGPAPSGLRKARVTIPVVMSGAVSDPVQSGLVTSLARPGGNFTGMSLLIAQLDRKRLEILRRSFLGSCEWPFSGAQTVSRTGRRLRRRHRF
jgi:ABC-type uncharacterized transport system substrate-binding protein